MRIGTLVAVAALTIACAWRPAAAETLTVCLETDTVPFSYHNDTKTGGFDLSVAKAVAKQLGRDLKIRWFEIAKTPDNDEPDPARAENALLNAGKCQLVGGFLLIENDLTPTTDTSAIAEFEGQTRAERKKVVHIGKLAASKPYYYFAYTVLLGGKGAGRKIASLDDLGGLRIASEDGTLADAMLMWYGHRRYLRQITHYTPAKSIEHGGGLLEHLAKGDFDATLVPMRRYDAYHAEHPDGKVAPSGYYYRIGFNVGFVARAQDAALIAKVDGALDTLIAKGELPVMAKAEGMTYIAPQKPAVRGGVSLGDLMSDDK